MEDILKKINKFIPFSFVEILTIILIVYGIFIRLKEYLFNRSIWLDEAWLALDVIEKNFSQLFSFDQGAPVGFVIITKILLILFGNNEYVLRSIPFFMGIISFWLFFLLFKKYSKSGNFLIALVLFSLSPIFLRYATEFKPYSSDACITLLIVLFGAALIFNKFNFQKMFQLGVVGAVFIWFSFPSIFVLGGVGIALLLLFLSKKQWKEIRYLFVSFSIWGLSFSLLYIFSLHKVSNNASLSSYWTHSFIPLSPYSLNGQRLNVFLKMFFYLGNIEQYFLGMITFILGGYSLCKRNKTLFMMLLWPLILTLLASSIHKYPFEGRLLLFYVPIIYFMVAEGIMFLLRKASYFSRILGIIFLVAIIMPSIILAPKYLTQRMVYSEEIKPILKYVQEHIKEKDSIYVYYGAVPVFAYYKERYGLDNFNYIEGISSKNNFEKYKEDLDQLKGQGRVWIIFAHNYHNERGEREDVYMVNYLDSIGIRTALVEDSGTAGYLYQLNDH